MRQILMLEHDDDDRYISQQTFDETNSHVRLHFVTSSHELFEFLERCQKSAQPLPSLILLNYYSFPLNSVDVLKTIKRNPQYAHIPVIILSGSVNEQMIKECYEAGCNTFIQKPASSVDTQKKIRNFVDYWFHTASLA